MVYRGGICCISGDGKHSLRPVCRGGREESLYHVFGNRGTKEKFPVGEMGGAFRDRAASGYSGSGRLFCPAADGGREGQRLWKAVSWNDSYPVDLQSGYVPVPPVRMPSVVREYQHMCWRAAVCARGAPADRAWRRYLAVFLMRMGWQMELLSVIIYLCSCSPFGSAGRSGGERWRDDNLDYRYICMVPLLRREASG